MPFGLKTVSETFQIAMEDILAYIYLSFALMLLNDIVVFSISPADHIKQDLRVLWLLYDAGVTLKLGNCKFLA